MGAPGALSAAVVRHSVDRPMPVLTVTARVTVSGADAVAAECLAALRETATRLGVDVIGVPLLVDHADPSVVEVCLELAALPPADPPAPVAAEVLVPGTIVTSLDAG